MRPLVSVIASVSDYAFVIVLVLACLFRLSCLARAAQRELMVVSPFGSIVGLLHCAYTAQEECISFDLHLPAVCL